MEQLTREMEWFLNIMCDKFGVEVTADVIALEAVEFGLDEVESFYIPDRLFDTKPETLLYEIMVTDDEEGNEWVGGIAFHPNSPEWCIQIMLKNRHLVYRKQLPLIN